jgi:hypothetical protein
MQGYASGSVRLVHIFMLMVYTFLPNDTQFKMNKIHNAAVTPSSQVTILRLSDEPISLSFSVKMDALGCIETSLNLWQPTE